MNDAHGQTDVMHDPNYLRSLLAHNNPRFRAQGEAGLKQLEADEASKDRLAQFQQREADRNRAHDENLGLRQSEADNRGVQREAMAAEGKNKDEDRRSAMLHTILNDPTAKPEIKEAIQNHLLKQAGVTATLPVDPKVAALARSKGMQAPAPQTVGGNAPATTASATTSPTTPTGAEGSPQLTAAGVSLGAPTPYPVLPNTPEQRFVPLGHGSLEGSRFVNDNGNVGVQTPSGGRIGGVSEATVARHPEWSPSQLTAQQTPAATGTAPSNVAESRPDILPTARPGLEGATNFLHKAGDFLAGKVTPEQAAAGRPDIPGTERPGLGLFGGGHGVTPIVNNQTPSTGPQPATPAPGTQFQGPVTGAAGFAGAPLAPTPPPSTTPPAIPPVKRPTPDEERQRLMANQ